MVSHIQDELQINKELPCNKPKIISEVYNHLNMHKHAEFKASSS
jgi:hypothetical protein